MHVTSKIINKVAVFVVGGYLRLYCLHRSSALERNDVVARFLSTWYHVLEVEYFVIHLRD
jgi:hypothetical protein